MTADPAPTKPIARKAAAKVRPVNRMAWYWSAVALFALGLMSKPMVVTLPFVLLLLDYWPLKRFASLKAAGISSKPFGSGGPTSQSIGRLLLEKGPFFLLTAMSCVATLWAQKSQAIVGLDVLPLSVRFGNAVVSYALYLRTTIWPAKLAAVYPYAGEWPLASIAAAAVCLFTVSAVAICQARRRPYFTVGWLWFLGTLLPVIGLVQVGIQSRADRYTYLPLIGVFMMVAWGGAEALTKRPQARQWVISVAALMLLALLVSTRMQMQHWRNGVELFTRAAEINPDCYLVECNLAEALAQQGDFEEAVAHYRKAIAIRPNRLEIARGFKIAAQSNLGKLFAARGKWAEAENQFRAAVVEDPRSWEARVNLGNVLLGVGRVGEAVAVFRDGVKASPESAELWRRLGVALFTQGNGAEALKAYREAARLNPDGPAELNALAWFLATSPQAELRNGAEAVRLAQRACALSGGREALFLGTLDAALAETGRFAEALAAAQSAQRMAREQGNNELAIAAQERMALYQSGKPYRQR